jgi:hypothetical protein
MEVYANHAKKQLSWTTSHILAKPFDPTHDIGKPICFEKLGGNF